MVLGRGMDLTRPSILATLLWAIGVFVIGLTVYSLIFWEGGLTTLDLHDSLLIFVAFSSGINAIATGAHRHAHNAIQKRKQSPPLTRSRKGKNSNVQIINYGMHARFGSLEKKWVRRLFGLYAEESLGHLHSLSRISAACMQ